MLKDKLLIWKFKCGDSSALSRIYEKYKNDLLRLATILLNNVTDAEDAVQDVFITFAQSASRLKLRGSLKAYLLTCVANRARNLNKANKHRQALPLDEAASLASPSKTPYQWIVCSDELTRWSNLMAKLPYEQREVVIMRLRAGMKFKAIARLQDVSPNTVRGRYRYGLDKLRSLLDGELEK
ncbi:MAG: RNA polymerase sigma factor [Planctomycetota bacterium]|jgi:RNA polymerase sigma-70 factor (ECF subfamily)